MKGAPREQICRQHSKSVDRVGDTQYRCRLERVEGSPMPCKLHGLFRKGVKSVVASPIRPVRRDLQNPGVAPLVEKCRHGTASQTIAPLVLPPTRHWSSHHHHLRLWISSSTRIDPPLLAFFFRATCVGTLDLFCVSVLSLIRSADK